MAMKYRVYYRPREVLPVRVLLQINKCYPELIRKHDPDAEDLQTFLLRRIRPDDATPPAIRAWHRRMKTWLPAKAFTWWFRQHFDDNHLEPMQRAWWLENAVAFIVATDGSRICGAVALTEVFVRDRRIRGGAPGGDVLAYEIRCLLVKPADRRRGVGSGLIRAALRAARKLGKAPTFASTVNQVAAGLFAGLGGDPNGDVRWSYVNEYGNELKFRFNASMACWEQGYMLVGDTCSQCPVNPGQFYLWSTHEPRPGMS